MTMPSSLLGLLLCTLLVAGCAPAELDNTISEETLEKDPPEIVPLDGLLNAPGTRLTDEDADDLLTRARATEARAARTR